MLGPFSKLPMRERIGVPVAILAVGLRSLRR
jgi:hypothetical protein